MKLTMKLFISLVLTLIVGAQAFASNKSFYVNIVNKNCSRYFRLSADNMPFVYETKDVLLGTNSGYIKVPAGGTLASVANWDSLILGSVFAPQPNKHYRIVFRMRGPFCFADA